MDDPMARPADEPTKPVTLPWLEPGDRELKDMFASSVIVVLLVFAVVGLANAARGVPGHQLASAVMALVLAGLALLSWYGPFGTVGLRASVDGRGLHLRHRGWRLWRTDTTIELSLPRHLPADQIGTVEIVSEKKRRSMWTKSMALGYKGRRHGWMRTTIDRDTTEAVFIEQTGTDLRRPWWLLRCNDCPGLIAALELARSQADPK